MGQGGLAPGHTAVPRSARAHDVPLPMCFELRGLYALSHTGGGGVRRRTRPADDPEPADEFTTGDVRRRSIVFLVQLRLFLMRAMEGLSRARVRACVCACLSKCQFFFAKAPGRPWSVLSHPCSVTRMFKRSSALPCCLPGRCVGSSCRARARPNMRLFWYRTRRDLVHSGRLDQCPVCRVHRVWVSVVVLQ